MKKILSVLAVAAMTISLLTGCVTATPKLPQAPPPAAEKTYEIEIINETTNIVVLIVCITPFPPAPNKKCIATNILVVPESWIDKFKEDGSNPTSKQVIHLKPGKYVFFIAARDMRTGQTDKAYSIFIADGVGQLIFRDKGMGVQNV